MLKPFLDRWLEGIQFASSGPMRWSLRRLDQIFRYRAPADMQLPCDFAHGPVFDKVEAMNLVDLFVRQHWVVYKTRFPMLPKRCSFQDGGLASLAKATG